MNLNTFGEIVQKICTECYGGLIVRYKYKLKGDEETAKDIVNDSFLLMLKKKEELAGLNEAQLKSWLMQTIDYKLLECWRKRKENREISMEDPTVMEEVEYKEGDYSVDWIDEKDSRPDKIQKPPAGVTETDKFVFYVQKIAERLEGDELQLFIGRVINDKSHKELAQVLGCSEDAVKGRWNRMKKKMPKLLKGVVEKDLIKRFVNKL